MMDLEEMFSILSVGDLFQHVRKIFKHDHCKAFSKLFKHFKYVMWEDQEDEDKGEPSVEEQKA